jgi:hypothetical protein
MDGGEKLVGACGHGPRGHTSKKWRCKEREGSTGKLSERQNEDGEGSEAKGTRRSGRHSGDVAAGLRVLKRVGAGKKLEKGKGVDGSGSPLKAG